MTKLQDGLNYMLGQYIMTGAHNPKKYPKKPYLQKEKKRWLEEDELIDRAKAITKEENKIFLYLFIEDNFLF